jgi:steroid delta-isomerase-like uncharacterized protein
MEAYNRHDAVAASSLYDEGATNTQWPWASRVDGRDAVRSTFERTFRAFPDIHVVANSLLDAGEHAVLEWTFSGTMRGEFAGHPPSGRRFVMRGCEVFLVRRARIVAQRGYWDKATMFDQLGLGNGAPS